MFPVSDFTALNKSNSSLDIKAQALRYALLIVNHLRTGDKEKHIK